MINEVTLDKKIKNKPKDGKIKYIELLDTLPVFNLSKRTLTLKINKIAKIKILRLEANPRTESNAIIKIKK